MTNYNEIASQNLNEIMVELAQYTRMAEEIAAIAEKFTKTTTAKRFTFV